MWTQERDAELNKLWKDHSASEIAALLGTTRNAVIGRYHRVHRTYADYNSKLAETQKAQTALARAKIEKAESQIISEMKGRIAGGSPRDIAICWARKSGVRLQVIGDAVGITRERVRQIQLEREKESV